MPTRLRRKSRFAFLLLPAVLLAVTVYFGWQSVRGAYGEAARLELRRERSAHEAELAALVADRTALETRVERLRTDHLDADLLDERVRAELNMVHPNELVILHQRPQAGDVALR